MARDQKLDPLKPIEEMLEEANQASIKPPKTLLEPRTDEEAAEVLVQAGRKAIARLEAIVSDPGASDSVIVQTAREIAAAIDRLKLARGAENKLTNITVRFIRPD